MAKANDGKSLFLYTALIFIFAILMIVLAFFSRTNLDSHKSAEGPPVTQTSGGGITERAAVLSEENLILQETNRDLTEKNTFLTGENKRMSDQSEILYAQQQNSNTLMDIYMLLNKGKYSAANELIATVNPDTLTEKQKEFFDVLMTKTKPSKK